MYCQVINHLDTHASDDIVEMEEADVTRFVQTDRMKESKFEARLWKKALRCGSELSVDKLKGIHIEGLKTRMRQNARSHWVNNPDVQLPAITRYGTSVARIAAKGNKPTPKHTKDTKNRVRRGG